MFFHIGSAHIHRNWTAGCTTRFGVAVHYQTLHLVIDNISTKDYTVCVILLWFWGYCFIFLGKNHSSLRIFRQTGGAAEIEKEGTQQHERFEASDLLRKTVAGDKQRPGEAGLCGRPAGAGLGLLLHTGGATKRGRLLRRPAARPRLYEPGHGHVLYDHPLLPVFQEHSGARL